MLELIKSVIKSIGKAVYEDKEIKKLADKYPRTFRFFRGRFSADKEFGLYLTIGIILSAIFIFLFFSLIEDIIRSDPIVQADLRIINLLQLFRIPVFSKLMLFITYLGNWEIVFLGLGLLCIILAIAKKWRYILALLISVGVGEVFVWIVKHIIQRPRPLLVNALIQEDSFSFPSGHAFISISFYGLVTYFLFRASRTKLQKTLSLILGLGLIVAIGFSRIYLGVHWPSDILASYAAGVAWLVMIITALQIEEKFHSDRKVKESSFYPNKKIITLLSILFLFVFLGSATLFYQTHPLKILSSSENTAIILEKDISNNLFNNLPRTSEDLTGNPIEPINIIVVGNESQLDNIFHDAGWVKNDQISLKSILLSIRALVFHNPYPQAPGSPSFWDTRPNDFAYERPTTKNSISERNHIHFWKTPLVTNTKKTVWFATAHFDTKVQLKSGGIFITHSIDPAVDKERDKVKDDLLSTGEVNSIQEIKVVEPTLGSNTAGSLFFTDGKAEIIFLS